MSDVSAYHICTYVRRVYVSDDPIIEAIQYTYNVQKEQKLTQHDFATTRGMRIGPNLEMSRTAGRWFNVREINPGIEVWRDFCTKERHEKKTNRRSTRIKMRPGFTSNNNTNKGLRHDPDIKKNKIKQQQKQKEKQKQKSKSKKTNNQKSKVQR